MPDYNSIIWSVEIAISEYECVNGRKPGTILMERDAFYVADHGPAFIREKDKKGFRTIFGIPVKPVDSDGYGIYISGGKIPIRILNPYSDRTVYLFDEQNKKEVCVDDQGKNVWHSPEGDSK